MYFIKSIFEYDLVFEYPLEIAPYVDPYPKPTQVDA